MVDVNALKRKFPDRRQPVGNADAGPLHRKSSKAAVKAIAREYERRSAEIQANTPTLKKGPVFYAIVILGLVIVGSFVLSATKEGIGWGPKRIPRKPLQATKSVNAVAEALGRYKFHVGDYPSTAEGLAVLAAKRSTKPGWDGPYVNHVVKDPWGNDYVYETRPEGGHPVLYSKGPNGRAGDDDDVLPEQETFDRAFNDTSWTNGWAPYRLRGVVVAPDEETKRLIEKEMKEYDK